MIEIINNRVYSWCIETQEEGEKLSKISASNHLNRYNVSNWLWVNYPEGEPIFSPQPYTPEQAEQLRKEWVRTQIEKLYPHDVQLKILTENQLGETEAFQAMQAERARIQEESKQMDFQHREEQV